MTQTERRTPVDITVGRNILALRLANGMSRVQLGDKIGVTHQQLAKYEKGTNRVSAGMLQKLANAFYMHVADLFPANENKKPGRTRVVLELIRGFNNLTPVQQDAIVTLVRSL